MTLRLFVFLVCNSSFILLFVVCFELTHSFFVFSAGNRDYLVVGSDSGRIVILQVDLSGAQPQFVTVHEETFGKSGCRRIVPGQYLAADPNGRAVMIAAIEKQKFVYILNRRLLPSLSTPFQLSPCLCFWGASLLSNPLLRFSILLLNCSFSRCLLSPAVLLVAMILFLSLGDAASNVTISSPLEAFKSHSIVYSCVAVDVGFENPLFACLEACFFYLLLLFLH